MHCLLEGLAQAEYRDYLGLTTKAAAKARSEAESRPAFTYDFQAPDHAEALTDKERKQVKSIHALLLSAVDDLTTEDDVAQISNHISSLEQKLYTKNMASLRFVATTLGLSPDRGRGKVLKIHWAKALTEWVRSFFNLINETRLIVHSANQSR